MQHVTSMVAGIEGLGIQRALQDALLARSII